MGRGARTRRAHPLLRKSFSGHPDSASPTLQLGQTLTTAVEHFDDPPASLRHTVTVTLDAETFTQAAAAFALSGLGRPTVLTATFDAADLVGHPLSASAFVRSSGVGGIPFGEVTHTYTPYVLVGQGDGDAAVVAPLRTRRH